MPLDPAEVERLFRSSGALRDGHFVLASGRHSSLYLEKFVILHRPRETQKLCAGIAEWARALEVTTVAGPTTGGMILAFETARQLGTRALFAERVEGTRGRVFKRGESVEPGERVLVVDDVMTTGGSVRETIAAVREAGGTVPAAAVLVDRSGGHAELGVPLHALWRLDLPTFTAEECPQCKEGVPTTHPGTTPAPAGVAR